MIFRVLIFHVTCSFQCCATCCRSNKTNLCDGHGTGYSYAVSLVEAAVSHRCFTLDLRLVTVEIYVYIYIYTATTSGGRGGYNKEWCRPFTFSLVLCCCVRVWFVLSAFKSGELFKLLIMLLNLWVRLVAHHIPSHIASWMASSVENLLLSSCLSCAMIW